MDGTTIFIGSKKSTMAYVLAVAMQMNNKGIAEMAIKARGKAISRAVDVAEIVRNKFVTTAKIQDIRISTEEVKSHDSEEPIKVSSIEILLKNEKPAQAQNP